MVFLIKNAPLSQEVRFHFYIILQMPLAVSKTLGARIIGGIIHNQ